MDCFTVKALHSGEMQLRFLGWRLEGPVWVAAPLAYACRRVVKL